MGNVNQAEIERIKEANKKQLQKQLEQAILETQDIDKFYQVLHLAYLFFRSKDEGNRQNYLSNIMKILTGEI